MSEKPEQPAYGGLSETVDLLAARLPSRALQYLLRIHAVGEEVLEQQNISDQTIARLLEEVGIGIREVIESDVFQRSLLRSVGEGVDLWEHLDPNMREKENPLVHSVLSLLVSKGILTMAEEE
ncbi:hypothetical protein COU76_00295 [Candidatus Peregrinibacteria bacterium CG10_big_fil_rev_8_21_14_0_10_49_10]|nr:MAG: hypothetical protein COU76_00295 [Candidatus Peregrinibacteria bacterium CG10_big_fil_rev_8_21_14_0_10_49_10]